MVPIGIPENGIALPGLDVGLGWLAITLVADGEALRRKNVGLLTVIIGDEGDEGGPVRVVFDPGDALPGTSNFVPLEIDDAIETLRASATTTRGDPSGVVPAARFRQTLGEGL